MGKQRIWCIDWPSGKDQWSPAQVKRCSGSSEKISNICEGSDSKWEKGGAEKGRCLEQDKKETRTCHAVVKGAQVPQGLAEKEDQMTGGGLDFGCKSCQRRRVRMDHWRVKFRL